MVEISEDSPSDLIFFDTFSHDLHEVRKNLVKKLKFEVSHIFPV